MDGLDVQVLFGEISRIGGVSLFASLRGSEQQAMHLLCVSMNESTDLSSPPFTSTAGLLLVSPSLSLTVLTVNPTLK